MILKHVLLDAIILNTIFYHDIIINSINNITIIQMHGIKLSMSWGMDSQ